MSGLVSQSVRRVEDRPLLTGRGQYLDDLTLPGMLSVAFVRSPHAHARVRSVDTRSALALDHIVAAWTGADVSRLCKPLQAVVADPGYRMTAWPALVVDRVRFAGEAIVAVVGKDRYVAEDAADSVEVVYEPLPALGNALAALRNGAERVHEEIEDNVLFRLRRAAGPIAEAFEQAEIVLEETFTQQRCAAMPLETRGVVASVERSGVLTVWSSTQTPHLLRTGLAQCLGLPESRLRVVVPDVGGGFGLKMQLFPEEVVIALLALHLKRPVKWVEDRRENLLASAHARDHIARVALAATRDGRILGLKARFVCDVGAYSLYPLSASLEPATAAGTLPGPYAIPAYEYEALAVATNRCPTGAYRGVGWVMSTFVRERLIDMLARRIGCDPVELRQRNFIRADEFPYASATGVVLEPLSLAGTTRRLLDVADYERLRQEPRSVDGRRYRGIGICVYIEPTATGSATFRRRGIVAVPGFDAARVRIEPSGDVRAYVSATSQGQGHLTTLAQIVADELHLPLERVAIVEGDTDACPYGSGTFASRSTVVSGGALILAARKLRDKVLDIAAVLLEAAREDLVWDGELIAVRGATSRGLTFRDVAAAGYQALVRDRLPDAEPGLEATVHYDPPMHTLANGAHLAEVEVDVETGTVSVRRYVMVDDCGRIVNPMIVEGQAHGAVAQGLGNALLEAIVYDADGQSLTATLMDYLIPTAMEMPPMDVVHLETLPAQTVAGFKGAAEGGTIGSVAAIANAVADALAPFGIQVRDLPLSPDRIARMLGWKLPAVTGETDVLHARHAEVGDQS